ncbi:MAG TPA: RHS repeat-associated core domain-containing protein [Terriglobia bacterium]|nr:RHS repeat-associated core domain-containing protein [Terriglobia bacterium]
MTYDAAGNLLSNGTGTGSSSYTWDAEGRLASVDGGATSTYIYNALGQQAEIQLTGPARNFERLYDPAGQELSEFNATSPYYMWTWQNVRVGGKLVAHYWWAGAGSFANFVHLNYLGSTSMVTDYSGATVMDEVRYPWGQEWLHSGSRYDEHFAGMSWHDYSADLDPTPNRMYSSTYGRWLTPDPLGGDVTNPQSLNRYAYVLNNPTSFIDPSGMGPCDRNPDAGMCNHDPRTNDAASSNLACIEAFGAGCIGAPGLFGVDEFDLAAAGLIALGPASAALPGCGAQFVTCVPYSGGVLGFDSSGIHEFGANSLDCATGEGCEAAGIEFLTFPSAEAGGGSIGGAGGGTGGCTNRILGAVNNQFGDSFTPADVGTGQFAPFSYPQVPGGTVNIDIFVRPQDQPDGVSPGRYPLNWWTYIIGYGPTLHIPGGPGGLDSPSTLIFSSSEFTAHIDSAFPYNPIGLLFHFSKDVVGIGGHSPCP